MDFTWNTRTVLENSSIKVIKYWQTPINEVLNVPLTSKRTSYECLAARSSPAVGNGARHYIPSMHPSQNEEDDPHLAMSMSCTMPWISCTLFTFKWSRRQPQNSNGCCDECTTFAKSCIVKRNSYNFLLIEIMQSLSYWKPSQWINIVKFHFQTTPCKFAHLDQVWCRCRHFLQFYRHLYERCLEWIPHTCETPLDDKTYALWPTNPWSTCVWLWHLHR